MTPFFRVVQVLALVSAILAAPVHQYKVHSTTSMQSVCNGLAPGGKLHGHYAQSTPAPYTIDVPSASVVAGSTIELTLKGITDLDEFKGVFVQAKTADNIVGKFSAGQSGTLIDCEPGKENSYLYISGEPVSSASVTWTAPIEWNDGVEIHFEVTFVKNYAIFWNNIKSEPISKAIAS